MYTPSFIKKRGTVGGETPQLVGVMAGKKPCPFDSVVIYMIVLVLRKGPVF